MMKFLGKGALRMVRVLRKTTALMLSMIASILSSFFSLRSLHESVAKEK